MAGNQKRRFLAERVGSELRVRLPFWVRQCSKAANDKDYQDTIEVTVSARLYYR